MSPQEPAEASVPDPEGGDTGDFFLEAHRLAQRLSELYPYPCPPPATPCGFGTPLKRGHPELVWLCNAPSRSWYTVLVPGTGGCCVRMRSCEDHARLMGRVREVPTWT